MSRRDCGAAESDYSLICASSGLSPRKRPGDHQHQVLLTRFPPASKPPLRSEILNLTNMIRSEHSTFNLMQASNIGLSERTTMARLPPIQLGHRTPPRTVAQQIITCARRRLACYPSTRPREMDVNIFRGIGATQMPLCAQALCSMDKHTTPMGRRDSKHEIQRLD